MVTLITGTNARRDSLKMEDRPSTNSSAAFHPCGVCGRTFHPDVVERHQRVCSKNASSKRKPFDTRKQRIMGTELQNLQLDKPKQEEPKKTPSKSTWKQKHELFVQTIRSARAVTKAIAAGEPLPEYIPSAPNPDYVQCPHCDRRFQHDTAERHMPFCKEKAQRMTTKATGAGKESLNKRKLYKPPALKVKSAGATKSSATHNPPGSSLVMKQTNFAGGTYTLNSNSNNTSSPAAGGGVPGGGAGPPQTTRGSSVRGSVVVGQPPSGKKTLSTESKVRKTVQVGGGGGSSSRHQSSTSTPAARINAAGNFKGSALGYGSSRQGVEYSDGGVGHDIDTDSLDSFSRDSLNAKIKKKSVVRQKRIEPTSDFDDSPVGVTSSGSRQHGLAPGRPNAHLDPYSHHHKHQQPQQQQQQPLESLDHYSHHKHHKQPQQQLESFGHHHHHHPQPQLQSSPVRESWSRTSSSSSTSRGPVLSEHGMPMSKYCYECGTKYPVPQAKYCCMCGIRRL